jgi:DNA-directed RNA polymerase subunit L
MKMNVLKDEGNEMSIEFDTDDVTVPDLIAAQMLKNPDVEFAGVEKEHPEVGHPKLLIKTGKKKPKDALAKALEEIEEQLEEIKKGISSSSKK